MLIDSLTIRNCKKYSLKFYFTLTKQPLQIKYRFTKKAAKALREKLYFSSNKSNIGQIPDKKIGEEK